MEIVFRRRMLAHLTALVVLCSTFCHGGEGNQQLLSKATHLFEEGGNWDTANQILLQVISDESASASTTSAGLALLQEWGDETCIPQVTRLATEGSSGTRERAVQVLREIKGRNAARAVREELLRLAPAQQAELSSTLASRSDLHSLPPAGEGYPAAAAIPTTATTGLRFERQRLSKERFEAASAADINQDGKPDIVSGGFWYPGPDFAVAHKICDVQTSGEYYDDFSDYPMDVNGDNYPDIITGGFFGGPLRWRENPRGATTEWKEHRIEHVGPIETTRFWDVDGDGHAELCPNAAGNIIVFKLIRDAEGRGTGEFTSHTLRKGGVGHGLGFGDINGDGRGDFVGPDGWYEAPAEPLGGEKWIFHRDFALGSASVPIVVHDVNEDGLADLIVGQGHDYGLHWVEQTRSPDGTRSWKKHVVEADRSQFHELFMADLDNDGRLELVTGKRWRAHNGKDPGADDPLALYYYKVDADGRFTRHTLDYGPPEKCSGTGIYLWVADIDGNGWPDIVAPGKQGLYLFRNEGY